MAEEDKKEELKNRLESSINEDDSGNYAGALAFELGVGLTADWLVASPDPLSRGLSFGIGYGANVIAQKIRGNEEFSHGEALAAGGFQAIPFGTTAKGLKGIRRATAKGAAIGVGGEQVRTAIDEQRLLTPGEALTAGTLGAGFGGTIKFGTESADILIQQARATRLSRQGKFWRSPDAGKMSPLDDAWKPGDITGPKKTYTQTAPRTAYPDAIPPDPWNPPDLQAHLFNYIDSTADVAPPVNPSVDDILRIQEELTGKRTEFLGQYTSRADIDMPQMMAKAPDNPQEWQLNLPFKQGYVPPDASQIWNTNQKLLKYSGLFGSGTRFNINAYRNIFNSAQGRQVAMLYSTTPHTGIATTWDKHRRGLVDAFESIYGDAMQQLRIPRSRIEIEHIFTLQQSMPIYDGLSFGDPMFNRVQQAILTRGYKPGNAADNLMAIPQWIHGQKTNYFNILHGKDGKGFFTRTVVRKFSKGKGWTQKQADAFRLETLERYLNEIDEGKRILDEGMKVFDTLHGKSRLPEKLVEELADIELHRYSAPELKSIVKDIVTEFDAKPLSRYTKAEFMEYLRRLDRSGDMLEDLTQPEQIKRLKEITGMSFEEIDSRMQAGWFTDLEGF